MFYSVSTLPFIAYIGGEKMNPLKIFYNVYFKVIN